MFTTNPDNATAIYNWIDENGTSQRGDTTTTGGLPGNAATTAGTTAAPVYRNAILNDANVMSSTFGIPGILTIDRDGAENAAKNVTDFQANQDTDARFTCTASQTTGSNTKWVNNYGTCSDPALAGDSAPMQFVETGANTGHFVNWDDGMKTNLIISLEAKRGTTLTIAYDDVR